MLRAEFFDGSTTYYWATEPLDYDNKIWEPRISKDFAIPRVFSHTDKFGSRKRTMSLTLDNRDKFFNGLVYDKDVTPSSPGMINQRITLYYEDGSNKTKKFVGRIAEINSFGLDVQLTLAENLYSYLDDPYPDAQIAYDYYSDQGINESWNAIPICFGQVERLKVMWIDKLEYRFMVCVGPIYEIDNIYYDKTNVYDRVKCTNGYQASPTSTNIKVRIFKGTGSVGSPERVEGKTSLYPGMCYIEFYDANTGLATSPMLVDGQVPEIFVDLKGIVNDSNTGAERNPAKILYKMYTNPRTGYNGWGLGISPSDVNFTQAITDCTTRAYCIDGVIAEKQTIGNWTDAILKCMAGRLEEDESGVLRLYIDGAKSTVQAAFDETGETGYNIVLGTWSEPPIESQINRLRVFYDKNQETGKWNRKPDTNAESPIGSPYLADATHAARILRWNTGTLELPLVRDDITADKLAQLYFKRDIQQLKTVTFDTEVDVLSTLDIDQLITITSPKFGWTAKQFTILEITKSQKTTTIKAQEYSSAAYIYQASVPPTAPSRTYYSAYDIPEIPQSFTMSNSGTGLQPDGTFKAFVNFSATMPRMGIKLNWYYKCHTDPNWIFIGQTDQTSQQFQWNQNAGNYDFTVNATSAIGNSGQYGGCITCCLTTDTAPNETPVISAAAQALGLKINITFDENCANNRDFNHFVVEQSNGSGIWATVDGNLRSKSLTVPSQNYSALSCFRIYAVDNSGNNSAYSNTTTQITPLQVVGNDITNNPIYGKCFQTSQTVGIGNPGVIFDSNGIRGYNDSSGTPTFTLDATTGGITANLGSVGGWTIATYGLYKNTGTAATSAGMAPGDYPFYAGCEYAGRATAPFRVSNAGAITATSGSVGGLCLGTYCLSSSYCSGSCCNGIVVCSGCPGYATMSYVCIYRVFSASEYSCLKMNDGGIELFFRPNTNLITYQSVGAYGTSSCACIAGTCTDYAILSGQGDTWGGALDVGKRNGADSTLCSAHVSGHMVCTYGCIKAGTCVTAGTVVWANGNSDPYAGGLSLWDGVPSNYGIAMRYNQTASFGWVGGGEYNSIFFHYSSGNRGWIFADNYTPRASIRASDGAATFGYVLSCYSIEAGTSIYAATSVTANTCVVAHAGAYISGYDLYTTKQVRAAGWYEGPWAGAAAELGFSGGIGYVASYDRTNSVYCELRLHGCTILMTSTGGSYNMILCANRNHLYDTSIYNTLYFVDGFPSTTLGAGYIQTTCLNINERVIATISCSTGIAGIVQVCNSNTSNGAYASISLCAGSCVGQIWLDNQNTTSYNGAGGLNVYALGAVSLWGNGSEQLRTTSSCVSVYVNLHASCQVKSTATYGVIALNGTLPGSSAMAYPTLCSSTAIYLAACGYYTGYFETQNLCVFGIVWAAAHCVSSSRTLKCNFTRVGPMLPSILKMDLQAWQRRNGDGKWGFGVMAEEFRDLFPWWGDGYGLPQLDQLALRGIQELDASFTDELKIINYNYKALTDCIASLESRLEQLEAKLNVV